MARMLGKKPYVHDPRTLRFAKYATALPAPAPSFNWDHYVSSWPMFLNDTLGDCTCAEIGHMIELFSATAGSEAVITDDEIEAVYEAVGGYVPGQPDTDQGCVIADVLAYWQKIGVAGHKITAYTGVTPLDHTEVAQAIDIFGGVDIGLQLPVAAQSMGQHWTAPPGWPAPTPIGQPTPPPAPAHHRHHWWDIFGDWAHSPVIAATTPPLTGDWAPGSWDGHSVYAVDYDANGVTVVTWGELTVVDWGFWDAYVDEVWAVISPDFLDAKGDTTGGFDLAQLEADLAALTAK